MYITAATVIKV